MTIYASVCGAENDNALPQELRECYPKSVSCFRPEIKSISISDGTGVPTSRIAHEFMHAIENSYYGDWAERWLNGIDSNGHTITEGIAEYGAFLVDPEGTRSNQAEFQLIKCIAETVAHERGTSPESVVIDILRGLGGWLLYLPFFGGVDGVVKQVTGRTLSEWKAMC